MYSNTPLSVRSSYGLHRHSLHPPRLQCVVIMRLSVRSPHFISLSRPVSDESMLVVVWSQHREGCNEINHSMSVDTQLLLFLDRRSFRISRMKTTTRSWIINARIWNTAIKELILRNVIVICFWIKFTNILSIVSTSGWIVGFVLLCCFSSFTRCRRRPTGNLIAGPLLC